MAARPPGGDTLVIDTVGVKTDRPYAMIDLFGTPYTKSLHVVRYRLREYDDVKDAIEGTKKRIGYSVDREERGFRRRRVRDVRGARRTGWRGLGAIKA
jgi:hypothetical protein